MKHGSPLTADIIAALTSIVALFGMLALHVNVFLSAGLAVATYVAVRLLVPAPKRIAEETPLQSARKSLDSIRTLVLTPPSVQVKLNEVAQSASTLLKFLEQSKAPDLETQGMLAQYLSLLTAALEKYRDAAKLSGGSPRQSTESVTQLLDGLTIRFQSLYEKLAHQEDKEVSTEIKALNQALTEMDNIVLKLRGDNP